MAKSAVVIAPRSKPAPAHQHQREHDMSTSTPEAPFGYDKNGRALAPYGYKADGTIKRTKGRTGRFGSLRKRGTRWNAQYSAPDGSRKSATFGSKQLADAWLAAERVKIDRGEWKSAAQLEAEREAEANACTLGQWAEEFIARLERAGRTPKTVQTYQSRINAHILPTFADAPLRSITEDDVTDWYTALDRARGNGVSRPVYMTLRAMMNDAVKAKRLTVSPV
ncbi:hypothetical protein GCM10009755_07210 [Brevibacterium samyangense]|uniref:Core-binding (CB) domain-containing protein n=2 Tax=Brevibacterium samyangense TaxID=366888 RepID=A0ABN2T8P8_9MICO